MQKVQELKLNDLLRGQLFNELYCGKRILNSKDLEKHCAESVCLAAHLRLCEHAKAIFEKLHGMSEEERAQALEALRQEKVQRS